MLKMRALVSLLAVVVVLFLGFLSFFISSELVETFTGLTTVARVRILELSPETCSVFLDDGLNVVSFPCETGVKNFSSALSDVNNVSLNFEYIFYFNPLNNVDPWNSFNPSLPNWTIQTSSTSFDRRRGYFVYMNEPGTYFAEGLRFNTSTMNLRSGWNLVGYPSETELEIVDALSSISDYYVSVHSFQLVNGSYSWLHHFKEGNSSLDYFVPGYGYWIYVNQNVDWVVTW